MGRSREGLVLGLAVSLVALGIGGYLYYDQQRARTDAVAVDAVVVESTVVSEPDAQDSSTNYYPDVTYEYTYDGREYTSEQVFPGVGTRETDESRAREIVDEYDPGDEVTAYVDPDDPGSAFLVRQQGSRLHLYLGGLGLAGTLLNGIGLGSRILDD